MYIYCKHMGWGIDMEIPFCNLNILSSLNIFSFIVYSKG